MKLPRDLSGNALAKALGNIDYQITRQTGSHLRLTATTPTGEHHITIPAHNPLKVGTLAAIIADIAVHHGLTRDEILKQLFP
ncbi:MAG: type II toxin-antitoxin system HicA family toxin [Desulfuromonadales bacterium]